MLSTETVGNRAVNSIFSTLQIDDQWSEFDEFGFTCWGHDLAQRVWTDEPMESHGIDIAAVHVETDLLRDVPASKYTVDLMAVLNGETTLHALVYDLRKWRIFFR